MVTGVKVNDNEIINFFSKQTSYNGNSMYLLGTNGTYFRNSSRFSSY